LVDARTAVATALMRAALNRAEGAGGANLGGYHGLWDVWEPPLARHDGIDPAIAGLRGAMMATADAVQASLREAESIWMTELWPERRHHVESGLATLSDRLQPAFPAMCRAQAQHLDHAWPERLDGYLVRDCCDRFEAYSQPLTMDVAGAMGSICARRCGTRSPMARSTIDVHETPPACPIAPCSS